MSLYLTLTQYFFPLPKGSDRKKKKKSQTLTSSRIEVYIIPLTLKSKDTKTSCINEMKSNNSEITEIY